MATLTSYNGETDRDEWEDELELDLSRHCAMGHHERCGSPMCGCTCHDEPTEGAPR